MSEYHLVIDFLELFLSKGLIPMGFVSVYLIGYDYKSKNLPDYYQPQNEHFYNLAPVLLFCFCLI